MPFRPCRTGFPRTRSSSSPDTLKGTSSTAVNGCSFIGLGAFILGLFYGGFPLVIPIAIAVFLASFIPVVGAVATGVFAVFVALVFLGPIPALIMLGIVILVQQLEGHVLQPLIIGNAIKVHPVAVVLAVATGGFIGGPVVRNAPAREPLRQW